MIASKHPPWSKSAQNDKPDQPAERCVFVIAEAGVNHNGDLEIATKLIDAAANAGADAVKFQTFKAESLVSANAPMAEYQRANVPGASNQFEMLQRLELDAKAHNILLAHCRKRNIEFLSTPFDDASVDLLVELGVRAIKVSSGDLTNHLLLEHIAGKRLPVILSTGMATVEEIERATLVFQRTRDADLAILHCVSAYPAAESDANLLVIPMLKERFGFPVGWSDHTRGDVTAIVAVGLGAAIIEKHITLDNSLQGPDHKASMEPAAFADYVRDLRIATASLGSGLKQPTAAEKEMALMARRSLAAARHINAGEKLTRDMLCAIRPGTGLPPYALDRMLGKRALVDIKCNVLLDPGMFS